jgi:prepilin-type N-terminal cleavage/methylation domain-containing protein
MRPVLRLRGFSLMEMMVALAIIAILFKLSVSTLSGLKSRGNFVSASGDLIEGLRGARAEAFGRGAPTVFIIDTVGGPDGRPRWWSVADLDNNFTLAAFNPATPAPSPDILLGSGILPTGVTFGPAGSPGGYGSALPQPYAGVPSYAGATPAPNFPYCSFCSAGSPAGFGAITFFGSGGAAFSGGTGTPLGHQFTIQAPQPSGTGLQIMTVAVIARTGASATFETSK